MSGSVRVRRLLRITKRVLLSLVGLVALYLLAALVLTAIPVNTGWRQPASGVEIVLDSNGYHVDFVVPITSEVVDWRQWVEDAHFANPYPAPTHLRIGWGDRGFMLEVPTLADLTPGIALRALLSLGGTAVHVYQEPEPPPAGPHAVRLVLTPEQYRLLAEHVQASVAKDARGAWRHIAGSGYGLADTFYEGTGRYGLFYTCNVWTNDALKRMGVRTGLWTPFAPCVLWHR